jgi:hypothetical protein
MNNLPQPIQKVTNLFAALPQVEAIAFGGSRSAGVADAASDFDIYIYTRADIPLTTRQAIIAQVGAATRADLGLTHWGPGDEWIDAATGLEIDLIYFDAQWMKEQLQRVIDHHQPSVGYTTAFWRTVRGATIVSDERGWFEQLQQWSDQPYPEPSRQKIIAHNQPVLRAVIPSYMHQLECAVARADLVSVNHRVAGLLASYFDILFALNRVLHPGEKRLLDYAQRECTLRPLHMTDDLLAFLQAAASTDADVITKGHQLIDGLDDVLRQEGML